MAEVLLGRFEKETIVVHFGGEVGRINAYTFGRSLIGFTDTARAVTAAVGPFSSTIMM
jgi:hypothetical protein